MTDALPLTLFAPLILLIAAGWALAHPGRRPEAVPRLSEAAAFASLVLGVAGVLQLILARPAQLMLVDGASAITLRLDAVSATMALLVGFIGWIVMRYARTYLDGEAGEGRFHGLMLATLAAVLMLAHSGSFAALILAFVAIGLILRQLLLFYPGRPEARRAAAKFSLVWHLGDAAMILATVLLYATFGTTTFTGIAAVAPAGLPGLAHLAVALLVLAVVLKTASFPVHGWLTEVMEAPTPVSALLHAGIINAGGFVLIRTADLVQASPGAMAALVMIGGLTALFGAVVMVTQSAIKTALAWSTVSQMGFMLLQCGLGLWPLALLHIVAHSLYKAHAFLSSGGAVAAVAGLRRPGPIAVPSIGAVMKAFALALALYASVAVLFTLVAGPKSAQALAIGAILIFGVAYLVAQGLADAAPVELTRRTGIASVGAALAYFAFQRGADLLWGPSLPTAPAVGPLEWALIVLALMSFGIVAVAQALFPLWAHHPATAGLRVHLANGLYLNALLDRLIGGFRAAKSN
ncbi:proton-conducting transporter transmembrane domain-containing protein [Roseisalinus antarcticus]|uniref:Probable inorganic carbon transporter subunit DabB n=1 Tax=Roseisalinus antarcticus TaxID=254357 RepID=A0A1Y5RVX3_9RHOB|nr:proton-conducting transporter membrane subunit [Roseisalinus antarcticus]SLN25691.1 NADH-quinone oxidoreductase subunit L [Roseisalinus antarcticus]